MNILLAYHCASWQRAGYFHDQYFRALGEDITLFPIEKSAYWTNYYDALPFYFPKGNPTSVSAIEEQAQKKFDVIIELDGEGQFHLTNPKKVPAILWSMDTHVPAKRRFQLYFEKEFKTIFSAHKDFIRYFKKVPCQWLPFACAPQLHKNLQLPKIYDVVFVGNTNPNVYPERTRLLQELSREYNVGLFNGKFKEDMVRVLNQGKIVFNKSFNGDLNMRVFEALGCGSFLLTDVIQNGLFDLFKDGKHLVTYENERDLKDKVSYYLRHDAEREEIAKNGQKEVLENHTYFQRAKMILQYLNQ